MLEPSVENRCEVTHSSAWPITPPRVSNAAGCQNWSAGTGAGTDPERPGGQRERQRSDQTDDSGPQRAGRRTQLAREDQAAAGDQPRRNRVTERAEAEPSRVHDAVPERTAGPMGVLDAAEEHADRDQREREDVELMGLERDRRHPRTCGQQ